MKTIIEQGQDKYVCKCRECGARFSYERSDVVMSYGAVTYGKCVARPQCGTRNHHDGAASTASGCGGGGLGLWSRHD